MVIAKGKELFLLRCEDDRLIKLHNSMYLEKEQFSKILAYKMYFSSCYILTDKFLLKSHNPSNPS